MKNRVNILRRISRIKKGKYSLFVLKNAKKTRCSNCEIFFYPNGMKFCRLGIIISKRTGNACYRNKIKRDIREIFRKSFLKRESHIDVLIRIFSGKEYIKTDAIKENIFKCIKNLTH